MNGGDQGPVSGIVIRSPHAAGLVAVDIRVNVFGGSNCCNNALVFERVYNSRIRADVYAGATPFAGNSVTGFAVKLLGCINNDAYFLSSINGIGFPPNSAFQEHHLFLGWDGPDSDGDGPRKHCSNANALGVILEGGVNGVITDDMEGQGGNHITGTIEGLVGTPIHLTGCFGDTIRDLDLEANGPNLQEGQAVGVPARSTLEKCTNIIVSGVQNVGATEKGTEVGELYLTNVTGVGVDGYYGMLTTGPNCIQVKTGVVLP